MEEKQSLEFNKEAPEIKVPETVMPNREEYRRLLKTGKDAEGHEAHPDDLKNLRNAKMVDLFKFAEEVNKANNMLKQYVDSMSGQNQWTLLMLIAFLIDKKVLTETATNDFEEYVRTVKAATDEARQFLVQKVKEQAETAKTAKIVTIDEIKKKNEEARTDEFTNSEPAGN